MEDAGLGGPALLERVWRGSGGLRRRLRTVAPSGREAVRGEIAGDFLGGVRGVSAFDGLRGAGRHGLRRGARARRGVRPGRWPLGCRSAGVAAL